MQDATRRQLDDLLKRKDKATAERETARQDEKRTEDQFAEDFKAFAFNIAEPLMQEFAEKLTARGYACDIYFRDERPDADREKDARLIFQAIPQAGGRSDMHPEFMIWGDRLSMQVGLYVSTLGGRGPGRSGGPAGKFKLESLTPELFERHLLAWLEQLL